MRKTTIDDKHRRVLEHWMDSISPTDIEDFFEVLENQQIRHLFINDKDSQITPDQVKWVLQGISAVRQQLQSIRAAAHQQRTINQNKKNTP